MLRQGIQGRGVLESPQCPEIAGARHALLICAGCEPEQRGTVAAMSDLITTVWEGLRNAGLPEVMLYLPDGSASRTHWDDTALIGPVRVALLADQDRGIVRIIPVSACIGIGIASPKGVDPVGYRGVVRTRLQALPGPESPG